MRMIWWIPNLKVISYDPSEASLTEPADRRWRTIPQRDEVNGLHGHRWEMFRKQNSSEYAAYEMLFTIMDFVNDFIVFKDPFLVVFLSNCFLWTGHEGRRQEVCYNTPRCVVDGVKWVWLKLAEFPCHLFPKWIFQWPIMTRESEP